MCDQAQDPRPLVLNTRTCRSSPPAVTRFTTQALRHPLSQAVLSEVPVFARRLIGLPINSADCLTGSPISSQSTDRKVCDLSPEPWGFLAAAALASRVLGLCQLSTSALENQVNYVLDAKRRQLSVSSRAPQPWLRSRGGGQRLPQAAAHAGGHRLPRHHAGGAPPLSPSSPPSPPPGRLACRAAVQAGQGALGGHVPLLWAARVGLGDRGTSSRGRPSAKP